MNDLDAYVICMQGMPPSEQLAHDCINSGAKFGIDIKMFDAVWGDRVDVIYNEFKLFPFPKIKDSRNRQGVRGCFLSHYLLWKKSVKENKNLLIFEHDAEIIRSIPIDKFLKINFDVLNLDAHSRTIENYTDYIKNNFGDVVEKHAEENIGKKGFALYNRTHIKGLHAYIIKPSGAEKLIRESHANGVLPADIAVNSVWCNLYKTVTSYCQLNPKSWVDKKKKSVYSYTKELV